MKKLITIAFLFIVFTVQAQTRVTKDAKGNYVQVSRADTGANKATGATFTDKTGKVFPVYVSSRGKLYYLRTSKSGNVYKSYIKV